MHLEFGYMLESRQRFVNLTLKCHLALFLNKKNYLNNKHYYLVQSIFGFSYNVT